MMGASFVINPELSILSLTYPVHLKNVSTISNEEKGQYFVCLHCNHESGAVQFTNVRYPHVEVLEKLLHKKEKFNSLLTTFLKYASKEDAVIALSQFLKSSIVSILILEFTDKKQDYYLL